MTTSRASHANHDAALRRAKAAKIVQLLEGRRLLAARVLEVGTGSGIISAELSRVVGSRGLVTSVDVVDERTAREGYDFKLIEGVELPFERGTFDVVISNHVIEHVGGESQQVAHVHEIARVLNPTGHFFLASPSRIGIVEPHFHLPLLSWIPPAAGDAYVRLTRRGTRYDCRLLSRHHLGEIFRAAGLSVRDVSLEALRLFADDPSAGALARILARVPTAAIRPLLPAVPTMVFVGRRSNALR
jgi:2-polyprenyl-3-methyl-5-hydroxy-6-metoxy-1,4-benzoquinol methylase